MALHNIRELLKRFKDLTLSDGYIKDACINVVQEMFETKLTHNDVRVQKNTIFIKAHPALKSEIHMHKKTVLDNINLTIGKDVVRNIV